jgi:glycerol-3-phosphate responsive antiterminator
MLVYPGGKFSSVQISLFISRFCMRDPRAVQKIDDERETCGIDLLELFPGLRGGVALIDPF